MPDRKSFAALVLEDGRAFVGASLGADVIGEGEVVFNTAMTGYQEVLTDPSYAGQMVCMTYPLQGNYGVRDADGESSRPWARALVVRWACPSPSHHSSEASLDEYLRRWSVPGIMDIDTRALTRHIRIRGTQRAVLVHESVAPSEARLAELAYAAKRVTPLAEQDLVAQTSRTSREEWLEPMPPELRARKHSDGEGLLVAVIDYGVKANILRSLRERRCRVLVLPHTATWADVRASGADGLVLSNGPGDPAVLDGPVQLAREALGQIPMFGICLGHQIMGRAAGATTSRLPYGHHGANHPVKDLDTGQVHITSQNHEFQVDAASIPDGDLYVSQRNLNDGSVEGLGHRTRAAFSVQYHPEGCPGPQDNQHLYDRFIDMVRSRAPVARAVAGMAEAVRPRKVLILGSGPIVIGQAAEFDYAGTQACKALREEGIETVLVNSNPATIMTDEEVADRVYLEPLTVEAVERIIERERPDALLPTLGGQTGLNLATDLANAGVLDRHGVRMLGATIDTIRKAEDRLAFKEMLEAIGEPVPVSRVCESIEEVKDFAGLNGLPLVIRPAYTLGGTGGGFVTTDTDLERVALRGLAASPIHQVLIERSLWGWKEIEYEVMRDGADTCITVCNMENLDPMGVHTGDSIVVAPAQTLSDRDHQMLRSSAIRIIRALGIEGGCNVQFALDPKSSQYYVIEVNPRVSRSSALASKATGYPIARVAAKVAVGRRLEEIRNEITGRTFAAFEPALDYCVVKIPRWPFDKFPAGDRRLGTQMASTGEVMAVERTFEAALTKAIRSLEQKPPADWDMGPESIDQPNDRRLFALLHALRNGADVGSLAARSGIDRWFIDRMASLVRIELEGDMRELRRAGFSDAMITALRGETVEPAQPTYKLVDTCAGEFEAATPYYYSCWEEEDETELENSPPLMAKSSASGVPAASKTSGNKPGDGADLQRTAMVVGSGPIRIGQGIEFDYCSVHAAWALREAGVRAVMVNSNPETVSTDFDTSDRLYFEPLDLDGALHVARAEEASGALVQFGGQTAINLAQPLDEHQVTILGSSVEAIDLAEDRRAFARSLDAIGVPQPMGGTTTTIEEAEAIAERAGYPVLVRPSYVLGGRAMEIVRNRDELRRYMAWAISAMPRGQVLVDKYLQGMEVEVDAISDGEVVVIPGVMQHVERAGVHSGDSYAVYPAQGLERAELDHIVDYTVRIARHLRLRGLVNVQYVVHRGHVYVLEVNPRASRTVPFLSKVTGVPIVKLATRVMLGEKLADLGWATGLVASRELIAVKAPVFSMNKLAAVDSYLGPEMKSTGEAIGIARNLNEALRKAFAASGMHVERGSAALLTIADADKPELFPIVSRLVELGCRLVATDGTARALRAAGFSPRVVAKIGEEGPTVVDVIVRGEVQLVINTMSNIYEDRGDGAPVFKDGFEIRRAAVERRIPCLTSLDTATALLESAVAAPDDVEVRTIDEWRGSLSASGRGSG
ncbi:MAG TPA: carbamoyl-phosphate synthase large subunit [Candidatus Dormibacteraeota bacterium]|nr:carbamoyl-phosphate synthase large subunit [Candidatus Dormibacteraeota bacterium]